MRDLDCCPLPTMRLSRQSLDEGYQLVTSIAPLPCKLQDFVELRDDCTLLRCPRNPDRPTSSHLKQSFGTQEAQRSQNRIGIDAEHRRQVFGLRNLLSRQRLAIRHGSSDLRCDLFVQQYRLASVHSGKCEPGITGRLLGFAVDRAHDHNDSSFMQTLESPVLDPVSPAPPSAEALFKEAQRRRRNRRLLGSGIVVAVVALFGLVVLAVSGSGDAALPVIPLAQPAFASTVLKSTTAAGGASFTLIDRVPLSACASVTGPQLVVYRGSIDFVRRVMVYSAGDSSCPTLPEPLTIQTPMATYRLLGGNVAPGIGTDASRPWLRSPSSVQSGRFSVWSTILYPDLSALLKAVPGPLVKGRTTVIGGVASTEYRGTTTLALLEHSDPAFVVGRTGVVEPDATSIVIPIGVWVDNHGRITRVSATEPIFLEVYTDRSTETGPQVTGTSTEIPSAPAISSPQQVGVTNLVLTFTRFGQKAISVPSEAVTVVSGGQR